MRSDLFFTMCDDGYEWRLPTEQQGTVRHLRLSRLWRFKSKSFGLWCRVGGPCCLHLHSFGWRWFSEMLVSYHNTITSQKTSTWSKEKVVPGGSKVVPVL